MHDAHLDELSEQGYTIVADAIAPEMISALNDDLLRLERELAVVPSRNDFEGHHTVRIYNLLIHGDLYERVPVHPHVLPIVEGVLDRGLSGVVAVVDRDRSG